MRLQWMFPDSSVNIISGNFYTEIKTERVEERWIGVVKDRLLGYNVLRVDFDPGTPREEMDAYMQTMLLAAEVRYNDIQGSQHVGTI